MRFFARSWCTTVSNSGNSAWLRSYLCNRKQFCRVNCVSSKAEGIHVGVPQGSCLDPLLFLIYINDLPQAVQNSTVSVYADDASLCYQSSDINELNEAIYNDLKQLDIWLQGDKISFNVAKHNVLKSRHEDLDLKIHDNDLEIIQKKYLGVQIDNSLNWKEYVKIVSTKVFFYPNKMLTIHVYLLYILILYNCTTLRDNNVRSKMA